MVLQTESIPIGTVFGNLEIDLSPSILGEIFLASWLIVKFIAKIQRRCLTL
jgi:hypothetical protein